MVLQDSPMKIRAISDLQRIRYSKNSPNMAILWPKYGPKHIYGMTRLFGPLYHFSKNLNQNKSSKSK